MTRSLALLILFLFAPMAAAAPPQSDALVTDLTSGDAARQRTAVNALQSRGRADPTVQSVIAAIARTARYDEPLFPVWERRRPPDPAMRPHVLAIAGALDDPVADNRVAAARALGEFFDPVVVPALIDTLDDPHAEVCEWAARSLGNIGDARAVDALIVHLVHADPEVREWLVRALSTFAAERSVAPLLARLGDSNATVRGWAARALLEMDSR